MYRKKTDYYAFPYFDAGGDDVMNNTSLWFTGGLFDLECMFFLGGGE